MPTNAIHGFWSERGTGLKCLRTHRLIDSFSSIKGKQHRNWLHTPLEAAAVAMVTEGPQCIPAALNHLYVDTMYNSPETKIAMEMIRLADKPTPPEKVGCYVRDRS